MVEFTTLELSWKLHFNEKHNVADRRMCCYEIYPNSGHESLCILSWISRCPMKFPSSYKRNSLGKPAVVCIALSDDCAECFSEVHNCNVAWERIFMISFSFTMYLLSQYPERVKTIWVLFTDLLLGGNHGFRIIIHHFYRLKT